MFHHEDTGPPIAPPVASCAVSRRAADRAGKAILLALCLSFGGMGMGCSQYLGYHYDASGGSQKEGKATRRQVRVQAYSAYSSESDYQEAVLWILGLPVGVMLIDRDSSDNHVVFQSLCLWPPFDLVNRLFGGYGVNWDCNEGTPGIYDEVPPPYYRRLLQWIGWVLPGYNVFHYPKYERYPRVLPGRRLQPIEN